MDTKKRVKINCRITQADKNEIDRICEKYGTNISELFRQYTKYFIHENREDKIFLRDQKFKKELLFELHKQGVNINQVAYDFNSFVKRNVLDRASQELTTALKIIDKIDNELLKIADLICERF